MNNLFKKSFLRLINFTYDEINQIINLAKILKIKKKNGNEKRYLNNKNIISIFEKDSLRTRCAFEVAAFDQGANITYLGPNEGQLKYKESIKDTARVLGRFYDGIQYRGFYQKTVKTISKFSNIPVWNGLTNEFHPTQILADLLTIKEYCPEKKLNEIKLLYIGDSRFNIANSLLEVSAITGLNLILISPKKFWPNKDLVKLCKKMSKKKGGDIIISNKYNKYISNIDFIYTDVWLSMGENKNNWKKRVSSLIDYQVNMKIIKKTNNPNIKFMHCLPSFHNSETKIGKKIINKYNLSNGIEVTNEVFNSKYSIVFDQAENRLHTIKALMISTLLDKVIK